METIWNTMSIQGVPKEIGICRRNAFFNETAVNFFFAQNLIDCHISSIVIFFSHLVYYKFVAPRFFERPTLKSIKFAHLSMKYINCKKKLCIIRTMNIKLTRYKDKIIK